ncbi:MAG: hypothetical protein CL678_17740 [Bdellovibrionaceae bacterium]|nr:hypothetical protein [Pseudobdellovibrionaceae bacterium]|tara:strand:+ start:1491 stop:2156 length:666 start_codon:yes stop_codon:yes gene_type:complete
MINFLSKTIVFLFLLQSFSGYASYPKHWWKPVDPQTAPSWEVLPQEAKEGEVILSKRNELGIFSNFAKTPFSLDGYSYESVEGFWQMMKYPDPLLQNDPRNQVSGWQYSRDEVSQLYGFTAKKAGKLAKKIMKKHHFYWISYLGKKIEDKGQDQKLHEKIIFRAIQSKINQNPKVKTLLLKTGNLVLKPDHHPSEEATPAYEYYRMLMEIRTQLQEVANLD